MVITNSNVVTQKLSHLHLYASSYIIQIIQIHCFFATNLFKSTFDLPSNLSQTTFVVLVCDTKVALDTLVVKEKVLGVRLDCEAKWDLEKLDLEEKVVDWVLDRLFKRGLG